MKVFKLRTALLSMTLICVGPMACSNESSEGAAEDSATTQPNAANPPDSLDNSSAGSAVALLSVDYLEGDWCYSRFVGGATVDEPHSINYVVRRDGTLDYEKNDTSEFTNEGIWSIEGEKLAISPWTSPPMSVLSASPEEFVLTGMGERYFIRGRCP